MHLSDERIAASIQGAAFFVSICIIGFAWGHEKVIRSLLPKESDYDPAKPAWSQTECHARVKIKSRDFFPKYWYWGNIRASLIFCLICLFTDLSGTSGTCRAGELAAGIIAVVNAIMFMTCKQAAWDYKSNEPDL